MTTTRQSSLTLHCITVAIALLSLALVQVCALTADPTVRVKPLPLYQVAVPVEVGYTIIFLSSGYVEDESTQFQLDVARIVNALIIEAPKLPWLRTHPVVRYRHFINMFGLFVPSQESGTSDQSTSTIRDTALGCLYTAVSPGEFRGRLQCDAQASLEYATVSPVDPRSYPGTTMVVVLVNTPHYGAQRQQNIAFISNQYLEDDMINTTMAVLLRTIGQAWFSLKDEFDYGDELPPHTVVGGGGDGTSTTYDIQNYPLAETPNCFDPASPLGMPWSTSIFEQKLDKGLASLALQPPYDLQLKLDDIPEAPCTYTNALRPGKSCAMQRQATASAAQRADPGKVAGDLRRTLLWGSTPAASTVLKNEDSVPHFCHVCSESMTRQFLSRYWERSAAVDFPSSINRIAMFQLPRCPFPNEIAVVTPAESPRFFANRHATWANGFETIWQLVTENSTVFLAGNVTAFSVQAAFVIQLTKRAANTIRLTTRDRWLRNILGPNAVKQLGRKTVDAETTEFQIQVVGSAASVPNTKIRQCDDVLFDLAVPPSKSRIAYRYLSFCSGTDVSACTYNYTMGSLSTLVSGFRINVPVAIGLFICLVIIVVPWVLVAFRYHRRSQRTKDHRLQYLREPLRRHLRVFRWFIFGTAGSLVVVAFSSWFTSAKLYIVTQTITEVTLGLSLLVAVIANVLALMPAYGSILRDWKPLVASAVLLFLCAVLLAVLSELLLTAASTSDPNTLLGSTLQSGWRSLVSATPQTACGFEASNACSGWLVTCEVATNTVDCPPGCAANLAQHTPCAKVVESLIAAQLSGIVTLLRGVAGCFMIAAIVFGVSAEGLYRLRSGESSHSSQKQSRDLFKDNGRAIDMKALFRRKTSDDDEDDEDDEDGTGRATRLKWHRKRMRKRLGAMLGGSGSLVKEKSMFDTTPAFEECTPPAAGELIRQLLHRPGDEDSTSSSDKSARGRRRAAGGGGGGGGGGLGERVSLSHGPEAPAAASGTLVALLNVMNAQQGERQQQASDWNLSGSPVAGDVTAPPEVPLATTFPSLHQAFVADAVQPTAAHRSPHSVTGALPPAVLSATRRRGVWSEWRVGDKQLSSSSGDEAEGNRAAFLFDASELQHRQTEARRTAADGPRHRAKMKRPTLDGFLRELANPILRDDAGSSARRLRTPTDAAGTPSPLAARGGGGGVSPVQPPVSVSPTNGFAIRRRNPPPAPPPTTARRTLRWSDDPNL